MDTAYNVLLDDIDYTYDDFGRMTNYYDIISDVDYTYNYEGLRTSKTVDGVTTQFVLDGGNVIAEIVGNNVTNYVRGLTGIIYRKTSDGTKTYYVTNHHGDVVKLVNSSGTVIKSYEYDEYGNEIGWELGLDEDDTNPFRYCGEYFDTESGLIYLRARYYDPSIGRFISEDPARDALNWYVYCGNNPINAWDPSGLEDVLLGDIMKKNNATVTVNQKSVFGFKWGLKSITVTLNNITKEYTSSDYVIINDKAVIDNSILMKDFELTEEQTIHQEGDLFLREEDAALAWGLKYNQKSIEDNLEYAVNIYVNDNSYTFRDTVVGTRDSVNPAVANEDYGVRSAVAHTHAAYKEYYANDMFSSSDIKYFCDNEINGYLVSPGGYLKKYTVSDKKKTTITNKMPYDTNHPKK